MAAAATVTVTTASATDTVCAASGTWRPIEGGRIESYIVRNVDVVGDLHGQPARTHGFHGGAGGDHQITLEVKLGDGVGGEVDGIHRVARLAASGTVDRSSIRVEGDATVGGRGQRQRGYGGDYGLRFARDLERRSDDVVDQQCEVACPGKRS